MTARVPYVSSTRRAPRRGTLPARDDVRRTAAVRAQGASATVVNELLAYGASAFDESALRDPPPLPLADESFVPVWEEYAADARRYGVCESLAHRLVQLNFPIEAGVSEQFTYQAATRRGIVDRNAGQGLAFDDPGGLELVLHSTAAGRIPVIIASARADFVRLIQAFTRRNEPSPVPDSMGACIVGGYNNWDRVHRLRADWEATTTAKPSDAEWSFFFQAISTTKELYQDRFIILSSGPYSATPAHALGLDEREWLRLSRLIRLEHECTHYFTRRVFGSMRNTLLDELCADYAGLVAATGAFRPDWFLRFVGLEDPSGYRIGGRLENYRGTPALSDPAFEVLQHLVRGATAQLARYDAWRRRTASATVADTVVALARIGLEVLATDDGADLLAAEVMP
jgi:hypothetical protein